MTTVLMYSLMTVSFGLHDPHIASKNMPSGVPSTSLNSPAE